MSLILRQVIKFSITGGMAFIVDFGGYFALTRSFTILRVYYLAVSVFTSFVAIGVAYLINRAWTFRDPRAASVRQYSQYLVVYMFGSIWQNTLLAAFVEWYKLPDLVAKVIAVLIVAFGWNFLLAKLWVFRYTRNAENPNDKNKYQTNEAS